jgi:hypothetical protein
LPVSSAAGAAWVVVSAGAPLARPVSSSRREKAKVFNRPLDAETEPCAVPLRAKPAIGLQSQVRYAASQRYQASPVLKPLKAKGKQRDGRLLRTAVNRRPDPPLIAENDHEIESLT